MNSVIRLMKGKVTCGTKPTMFRKIVEILPHMDKKYES